jgi:ribonuclease HI
MSEAQGRMWCDGGCSNYGTQQAQGYASYCLETRSGQKQVVRLSALPVVSSNNQAEYVALISALDDLRGRSERAGKSRAGTACSSTPIRSSWSES